MLQLQNQGSYNYKLKFSLVSRLYKHENRSENAEFPGFVQISITRCVTGMNSILRLTIGIVSKNKGAFYDDDKEET